MIPSGVAPLDQRLGGLLPGRTYLLSGAPGAGKTIASLQFLAAGLDAGERGAILTSDDPTDLLAQAEFLGIDAVAALHEERLVLLRYQLDFVRRFGRTPVADPVFEELRRLLGAEMPRRMVVDSIVPFLDAGPAAGPGIAGLARFLEESGVTAIVTYPGDLAGRYDRRLDPLLQRAAALVHLAAERDRTGRLDIQKARHPVVSTSAAHFRIEPGAGLVPLAGASRRRADDLPEETRRRLLFLDLGAGIPEDLLPAIRDHFDVAVRTNVASAFGDLASGLGAIVVGVRRDSVEDAITLVRQLRQTGNRAPVVFLSPYRLRTSDCTRALRAGADEFLTGELHAGEVVLRLEAVAARGRSAAAPAADAGVPIAVQPLADGGAPVPLDEEGFRAAVRAHLKDDRLPFFTLVELRPREARDDELARLAELALRTMRVDGGDLAGHVDGGVAVYLHSARRKDVVPFVERLRDEWRREGTGELEVRTTSYPADAPGVASFLEAR